MKNRKLEELFACKVSEMAAELADLAAVFRAGPPHPDAFEKVRVIAHSLHGAGKMYGFPCVSELGAGLERLVAAVRSGRLPLTDAVADLLGSAAALLRDLAAPGPMPAGLGDAISSLAWTCECAVHEASPAAGVAADPPPADPPQDPPSTA